MGDAVSVGKERLDILLVELGLAPSREKAKTLIMSGNVFVAGQREDKAGTKVNKDLEIIVKSNPNPYVSRGGFKLEKALKQYSIILKDKICMDVGASTGGFTDCMLQNGAKKVYAIDVGRGQLDWKLRQDPRVVCMEKTNIRYVTPEQVIDPIEFVSIDVSFISLLKVLPTVKLLMRDQCDMVCLVKPQFEAGREKVGKKGVVRDPLIHKEVLMRILSESVQMGFELIGLSFSPIKGPEGNIEYLLYVRKNTVEVSYDSFKAYIDAVVDQAHETL